MSERLPGVSGGDTPIDHSSEGAVRIVLERGRQMTEEGWSPEHDDEHDACELTRASAAYLFEAVTTANGACWPEDDPPGPPSPWPWDESWWKPSTDPIRNLEKAGALIAAEIDRLLRVRASDEPERSR